LGTNPFVVAEEVQSAIKELSEHPITSLAAYVANIGSLIYQRLLVYNRGTALLNPSLASKNNEMFRGMFVGYLKGRAWMIQINFPHDNGELLPPVLGKICEAPNEFCMFSGSKLVWFDVRATIFEPNSLVEAAELVQRYVQLCVNKRYEYEDCKNMGGHIHIVAITPEKFSWIVPPTESTA
jgi:hypothetical protein